MSETTNSAPRKKRSTGKTKQPSSAGGTPSASPPQDNGQPAWSVERSIETYQIRGWGEPYFRINQAGRVEVHPNPRVDNGVDLYELTVDLEGRGIDLPMVVRFPDILADRVRILNEAFERAIKEYNYEGTYRGVYPVKVNQQRHIVEEVVSAGRQWRFGLEAGSKAELLISLASMDEDEALIICNGYKDLEYIETALIALQCEKTVVIILERIEELDIAFRASEKLGVRPILGVRAKLASKGVGRWANSTGDRAKFGLTAAEIVQVVDRLAERNMLDSLQLLHFHIGSQISSIIPLKNALREASQFYVELAKMGANMQYLDVGGGLAVDYDGSKTDFHASMNYAIDEYASDVVGTIQEAVQKAGIPAPTIISESGRFVAAHQSVLVFEVLGANVTRFGTPPPPDPAANRVLRELYDTWKGVVPKNVQESWHDATQAKEEAQSLFKFGYLSLRERGQAERLFWHCCEKIWSTAQRLQSIPEELRAVERVLSAIYYCNFSIFQSAPDTWAIDHIFPIMPLHRLSERPTVTATLADLTCDSDGVIDHFLDVEEVREVLDVHALRPDDRYFLGLFLNGAYQEILGDMHNLFGDTNAVHVQLAEYGYEVSHVIKGDSMHEVLKFVEYDHEAMFERVRRQAERAFNKGRINLPQMKLLLKHYNDSLHSYTYLAGDR